MPDRYARPEQMNYFTLIPFTGLPGLHMLAKMSGAIYA